MTELIKCILVGETNVGKTSIVKRFQGKTVKPGDTLPTMALETNETMNLQAANGNTVALSIWDTAGQEHYRALMPTYFHNANVVLYVCSIDNKQSIEKITDWYHLAQQSTDETCASIIVANKSDLGFAEGVTIDDIRKVQFSINALEIFETSALNGQNINDLFSFIINTESITRNKEYMCQLSLKEKEAFAENQEQDQNNNSCCNIQ